MDPRRALAIGWMNLPDEGYRPWRELRYRQPTPGMGFVGTGDQATGTPVTLTHEEWWLVLRRARQAQARSIPLLTDAAGRPFSFVLTDDVLRQADQVTALLKGDIGIGGEVLGSAARDRYLVRSLEEEAITSSQLEGAITTRQVAKEMLRERRAPRNVSERMILNNYLAMQYVREVHTQPLTPELVRQIHRIVTEGTLDDPGDAGRVQRPDEPRVGVFAEHDEALLFAPPPADQLEHRLVALCRFANGVDDGPYLPGVLRALVVHFMMGYNHFFVDGNGRTARSLFYWSMLHEGYWLTEYVTISAILRRARVKYGMSFLDVETDGGDLTYFFTYHLPVLRRAIADLDAYIKRMTSELSAARRRLDPATGEFTLRQIALLDAALKNRARTWTAQAVAHQFAVTIQTAHSDLDDLVSRGWLQRRREGRHFVWSSTDTLTELVA